jgi:hypothetical protein
MISGQLTCPCDIVGIFKGFTFALLMLAPQPGLTVVDPSVAKALSEITLLGSGFVMGQSSDPV